MTTLFKSSVVLGFAALLVACGGGDDAAPAQNLTTAAAALTGDQESARVSTGATGTGSLTVNPSTGDVSGSITLDALAATVAHVHEAPAGTDAPPLIALTQASNVWSVPAGTRLTASQLASFNAGNLYFNAHSAANPNGEIRGQIGREVSTLRLSGRQEIPPVTSAASGAGQLVLDPTTRALTGGFQLSGLTASVAHIHPGATGVNNPPLISLTENPTGSGNWTVPAGTVLTTDQATALRAGEMYVNAHSTAYSAGEIRSQVGRTVRFADLSGGVEVPPTTSTATGRGFVVLDRATRQVTARVTTTGIAGTVAHIHPGAVGVNGAPLVTLAESPAGSGVWVTPAAATLTADQMKALLDGAMYFNVHSAALPAGEIRGQIDLD